MKETLLKLWAQFKSKVPGWVLKLQLFTGSLVALGVSAKEIVFPEPFAFINAWTVQLITFGTAATIALQFIEKVEKIVLSPNETLTNQTKEDIVVTIPAAEGGSVAEK
jgi:hypothetical protein